MADNVFMGQHQTPFKADVISGVAIQGVKIVTGDDNTDGGYVKTAGRQVRVVNMPYHPHAIGEGYVTGHSLVNIYGYNQSVGLASADMWGGGGFVAELSTAEILKVTSDSAQDAPAGTGALTINIWGLDTSDNEINEDVTTNGTTAVATTNAFSIVHGVKVLTAGSALHNVGNISIKNNASTSLVGYLLAERNQSMMGVYKVPTGKTLTLASMEGASMDAKNVEFQLHVKCPGEVYQIKEAKPTKDSPFKIDIHVILTAGCRVSLRTISLDTAGIAGAVLRGWIE